jgi:putative endonuclease
MSLERRALARRAEREAVRFLKKHGYKILARNFSCPVGELDVVALLDDVVCFVEVKAKSGSSAKHLEDRPCQFDVLAVRYDPQDRAHITHFPDAFEHD